MREPIVLGRSRVRAAILRAFFERPGFRAHVREVARLVAAGPAAVGRELDRLEQGGVLRSAVSGRNRVYELHSGSPVVSDLRPIVRRTVGAEGILRGIVAGEEGIEEAFVYGSYGTPKETALSDVDVFVVGRPGDRFWDRVVLAQRELGRDINVKHYAPDEVARLRKAGDRFIRSVYAGRRVTLKKRARRASR